MKKILFASVGLLFLSIYVASSSRDLMKNIVQRRDNACKQLQPSGHLYGGLYGLCFLPGYKSEVWYEKPVISPATCKDPRKINLYAICDSYLNGFVRSDTIFCGVRSYRPTSWGPEPMTDVELDSTEINVLLIERVERAFPEITLQNYLEKIKFRDKHKNGEENPGTTSKAGQPVFVRAYEKIENAYALLMNENIKQNLEYNLFDYLCFIPLKEMKAWLNYRLFGHLHEMVAVIPGYPYLFLRETVDPKSARSSFRQIDDAGIDSIVSRLNATYAYYRHKGFDEVFYTVTPNPVSIICPGYGRYNNVIRRVRDHPGLVMPMIDLIDRFDTTGCQLYFNSDSHWNFNGFNIWVNELNNRLRTVSKAQ
jgi:hypothetical protein